MEEHRKFNEDINVKIDLLLLLKKLKLAKGSDVLRIFNPEFNAAQEKE